ncbi:MAG: AraC family transcriptional regulator [Prevotella sp.]|nr:AraC family transcriptional regulator [Prevotella sp.]
MKKRKDGFLGERAIVLPPAVVETEAADPLASSLYVTDIGFYPSALYHFRERREPIGQYVLIYCVSGSGWYRVDGKEHRVGANEFFILPAGKPHAYGTGDADPWTLYWLHFGGQHAEFYAQGALLPQRIVPNIESRIGHRNNIFEEIFTTLEADHSIDALRLVSALLHYYLASMRYLQQYRQAESPQAKVAGEDGIAQAAIHYLKENVGRRLTTGEVAAYVGYSVSYFSALFKRTTGQSPIGYFNRLKIEVACQMLATTDIQVNQLCFKVGIDDPYYFSRLFSRQMGCSPVEYRRRQHASTPGG